MLSNQEIKARANECFLEENFEEAFSLLLTLGFEEFMPYVLNVQRKSNRPRWLEHEFGGKYFWEDFVFKSEVFEAIISSDYADDFLSIYFSKYDKPANKLIQKIADSYPELLIRGIRANRVFLKAEWIESLSVLQSFDSFKAHCIIWKDIQNLETTLWDNVQEKLDGLNSYTTYQILAEITIWLELKRFKSSNNHTTHFLGRVYSFFIEKIFPSLTAFNRREISKTEEDPFFKIFMEAFVSIHRSSENSSALIKTMNAVENWLYFYEKVCEPYFYDQKLQPAIENDLRLLQSSPEYYYSTLIDGVRYQIIQFLYQTQGGELVEFMEREEGLIIPKGRFPEDENINRNIAGLKYGTLLLLSDLGIENFIYNNKSFSTQEILRPLITFSLNRQIRYENAVRKHSDNAKNWFEAHFRLTMESFTQDVLKHPYFFSSIKEFQKLNYSAVGTPDDASEAIVALFGFSPSPSPLSRFDWQYDVWDRPLLRIDDYIYCPIIFWGANIWFYSFIQRALLIRGKNFLYSKEIPKMEAFLGSSFEKKGWKTKVISSCEANKINGDVDIIVEEENQTLLIQLKRTYLRLNIKDSYAEAKMVDRKAADQLTKAEVYLSTENLVYQLNNKPLKWIVSTSFEGIHGTIKDCRKINYFELILALRNSEILSLKELIAYLHSDKHLSSICDAAIKNTGAPGEMIKLLGLPLPLFEPKSYKLPLNSGDQAATEYYNKLYNEGLKCDLKNEKNKAIELFHKCTVLCESDAEAWSALANCLCDVKQYEQALLCFEKALRILPSDPFITRNLSSAYIESGQFFKGLSLLIDLYEKYPLLGNLKVEMVSAFFHLIQRGVLSGIEVAHLKQRLKALINE